MTEVTTDRNDRLVASPRSQSAMQLLTDLASYRLLVAVSLAITSITSFTDVTFNLPPAAVN